MPFFSGSDCMSAWNMPISQAVPSSTMGPSRIATIASASSIPRRSFAKISAADGVAESELVLVRDEHLDAGGAERDRTFVDEAALVRREERACEVDPHPVEIREARRFASSLCSRVRRRARRPARRRAPVRGRGVTVWINRRTGVMHRNRSCLALEHVLPRLLRPERFDPNRPRRRCSRTRCSGSRRLRSSVAAVALRRGFVCGRQHAR